MRACVYTRANTKKFYNEAIKVMPVLFSLFVGKGVNSYAFLKWLSCGTHPYRLLAPLCVTVCVSFKHRTTANLEIGEKNTFHTHIIYDDSETFKVISAATEVLGRWAILNCILGV